MTERELFEAIGHLDDDLILAADAPVKKRRRPPVYWRGFAAAAACACIFLGGITVWQRSAIPHDAVMLSAQPSEAAAAEADTDEAMADTAAPQTAGDAEANEGAAAQNAQDTAESSIALGVARCVQLDGVRYFESPAQIDFTANRDPDGVIADSVARDAFPETDGCSNFGAGYSYWISSEKAVIVEIDGEYWQFTAN
ncbi:hypothetical protein [Gemmiger sp.]|uniref:hypothetical protein n=1 Tax=Gemmiger sp. TaxID=2049027 RepID=UPI002E7792DF|nr:hypothetical protein [Gemmiger sp.]MED9885330.1 hypothetical protein [Gemmiger sp.]